MKLKLLKLLLIKHCLCSKRSSYLSQLQKCSRNPDRARRDVSCIKRRAYRTGKSHSDGKTMYINLQTRWFVFIGS